MKIQTVINLFVAFIVGYIIIGGALFLKSSADAASNEIERNTTSITKVLGHCGVENAIGAKC